MLVSQFPGFFAFLGRFLDEVQSHSDVNKMSVQNLATVFGPNILRPQVEDPVTIMEGAGRELGLGSPWSRAEPWLRSPDLPDLWEQRPWGWQG